MNLSIDKLENYFMGGKLPVWKVYSGRAVTGAPMETQLEDGISMEDSYNQLIGFIDQFDSGLVTITFHTKSQSKMSKKITVQLGNGDTSKQVKSTPAPRGNSFDDLMKMYAFFNSQTEERIRAAEHRIRQENEIQNLKDHLEYSEEPSMKEKLMMEGIGAVKQLLGANMAPRPAAQLGTLGQGESDTTQSTATGQQPSKGAGICLNTLLKDALRLQKAMPQFHPNLVIQAVINWVEKDTDTATGYITTLMQNNEGQTQN